MAPDPSADEQDALAAEAAELDGYFSDAPLDPQPEYPKFRDTFETAIVISNLPIVPEAKREKLTKVVMKLVSRIGTVQERPEDNWSGLLMSFSEEKGTTLGFCMVEYETAEQANNAVEVLQDYKFDKKHQLQVTLYNRAKELQALEASEFQAPDLKPFQEKPNAISWLEDPNQRDEYVIRHGKETVVRWFDCQNDPAVDYAGEREKEAGVNWCDYYCYWSPNGSVLVSFIISMHSFIPFHASHFQELLFFWWRHQLF